MKNTLMNLHDALCTISTKGNDSITMGNCLILIRQTVSKLEQEEKESEQENEK